MTSDLRLIRIPTVDDCPALCQRIAALVNAESTEAEVYPLRQTETFDKATVGALRGFASLERWCTKRYIVAQFVVN
jgi:hypothetical protein